MTTMLTKNDGQGRFWQK